LFWRDGGRLSNDLTVDALDRAIIKELQRDGRVTNQELASRVGLTPAPCLRRVRRLEADGVIRGYSAVVDHDAMGLGLEVIVNAELVAKDWETVRDFESRVAAMDSVVELRRMFGLPDYLIRVRVRDTAEYERWVTADLMGDPAIARLDSRMTMKVLKGSS
jgi:DNA-binding Lrp family transcriptional regulator